jgi:glycosyltransferase involved in cell wall biosynthesis
MNEMSAIIPPISVVLPVHNARLFLDESVSSIVNQTFSDFELVILDDASTDGSDRLLRKWEKRDSRIRLFHSSQKLGLAGSSNFVARKANAAVVARMDADDVSHPNRLRRQWEIIKNYPDVAVVGTLCDGIDASGRQVRPRDRWRLVRRSPYLPFPHGSVMFRKETFDAIGGYCEGFRSGEDQDLFYRMTKVGRVVTLPEILYHYRYHTENATLLTGATSVRAVTERHGENGQDLAAFYMLGAMRLWSGQPPGILPEILAKKILKWDLPSFTALISASLGSLSPGTLRFLLRSFIRARDVMAGLQVKDGRPYEWRSER